ncbi:HAD family hydrolase [Paenibacillus naphthalenovorans]|uniref:HAD family hydrolase n=1 Tax=Paenibacillus naphthalenovorans TaxID=162209 RepID=UPI0008854251|nr:HAD family hydrolase [Paenibacillus naphthalenovorans]SDI02346.1 putative hydrolase of the HAD superfamily [Paenibacillus naphthalenovorans]
MPVSFVWFDLGYTLVYQERENVYRQFLLEQGIDIGLESIEHAYHLTDKLFMREYPGALGQEMHTFYPWYIGVLNYTLQLSFPLSDQCERLRQIEKCRGLFWRTYPFVPSVLQLLKERSLGLGLISNWDLTARKVLEENKLSEYFDHIIVSSEVGVAKPDVEIFKKALQVSGVGPEQSLYVGDNYYDDVIGSSKVGMESCLINRFGNVGIEEIDSVRTISSVADLPRLLVAATMHIS